MQKTNRGGYIEGLIALVLGGAMLVGIVAAVFYFGERMVASYPQFAIALLVLVTAAVVLGLDAIGDAAAAYSSAVGHKHRRARAEADKLEAEAAAMARPPATEWLMDGESTNGVHR